MYKITYHGKTYACSQGETVLDTLIRAGINTPFSCRNGSCHTCLMQAKLGSPSDISQAPLKKSQVDKSYFLPCKCIPQSDLTVEIPTVDDLYSNARVIGKDMLNDSVCRILLETVAPLYFHAGQYINIRRPDGVIRSYSIASIPKQDAYLELHVTRHAGGEISQWLVDHVKQNQNIEFYGPFGECYYRNDMTDNNILLIGTGTGLAPLQGIVRDALASSHKGQIFLYHGNSSSKELYNQHIFSTIVNRYPNFHYQVCLSQESNIKNGSKGRADQIAYKNHPDLTGWFVFLAGNTDMVFAATEKAIQLGVKTSNIFADPFECGDLITAPGIPVESAEIRNTLPDLHHLTQNSMIVDPEYPPADPEMWQALDNGKLLSKLLRDFYIRVYKDDKLKGFFKDFTIERAIEKQFSFLKKVFTKEDVYFGDRPRNAHHWMVISNELFDYREKLMEMCLREHGLPEHLIVRWLNMEEAYRAVIVKSKAWPKIVEGVTYPLEGFDEITLDVGALCDGCTAEINAGEKVVYHLRLGTLYCSSCRQSTDSSAQ